MSVSRHLWAPLIAGAISVACNGEFRFDDGADASVTPCAANADCKLRTLFCDVSSAKCVACLSDVHCTELSRPRCDSALHACVECGSNQDCGSDGVCDPATRKCLPKCLEDINCPASTPRCDDVLHHCYECQKDDDCRGAARKRCEVPTGRCVECLADGHCSDGKQCLTSISRCVDCRSSADCSGQTPLCDPATNTCVVRP